MSEALRTLFSRSQLSATNAPTLETATLDLSSALHIRTFRFVLEEDGAGASPWTDDACVLLSRWLQQPGPAGERWVGDVWIGQRSERGAYLPQLDVAVASTAPIPGELFQSWLEDAAFLEEVEATSPIEPGWFPFVRVAVGKAVVGVWQLSVDFLLACSALYRQAHGLGGYSRDPYIQVAAGARIPVDFCWADGDGDAVGQAATLGAASIIDNRALALTDVPTAEAKWEQLQAFALRFDGFEEFGSYEASIDVRNSLHAQWVGSSTCDGSLAELRTALFIEAVTARMGGEVDEPFCAAVVQRIRETLGILHSERERLYQRMPKDADTGRKREKATAAVAGERAFADFSAEEQVARLHDVLFGRGPLEKEDAVRFAAEQLREKGLLAFQRLRQDGPIFEMVERTIEAAIRAELFDRPRRGWVRAIRPDARDYDVDLWRQCLLGALDRDAMHRDEAVRLAAEWGREQFGLAFARLPQGGVIDQGIRSALNSAIRRGDVERLDNHMIRKGQRG